MRTCLALLLFLLGSGSGFSRELHWRSVAVDAGLDREGRLHVRERQEMVFTGDWNGGERKFRVPLGQELKFHSLKRVDEGGEERELSEGDLDSVDHYEWTDSSTLRWRSRLPSDPMFENTTLVYILDYTLSDILLPRDGRFLLDHDFVFPDRGGSIERYTLRFSLDPVWQAEDSLPGVVELGPLMPGDSHVVTMPLTYLARGWPEGVRSGTIAAARHALAAALGISFVLLLGSFLHHEWKERRFEALPSPRAIDDRWLAENVFAFSPEVVGAAWDERTGASEVAAVLARLVAEGKLTSEIRREGKGWFGRDVLHMRLVAGRDTLNEYERKLVDALFFRGDETDTDSVKKHYARSGFDPSSKIRGDLKLRTEKLVRDGRKSKASFLPVLWVAVAWISVVAAAVFTSTMDLVVAIAACAAGVLTYVLSMVAAMEYRRAVTGLGSRLVVVFLPAGLWLVGVLLVLNSDPFRSSFPVLAGVTLASIAMAHSLLHSARWRAGLERLTFRKRLAAAREYFRTQLQSPAPKLQDAWFPYLVAFGLGGNVDRWFRSYGGRRAPHAHGASRLPSSSGGSSGSSGWTGGGGAFGGAGASASWAAAAGSMAAGVSSRSSSGGRGGGRSGGGGGGGW